jgi:glycosyltransferase involved in cell wall biosynthesis
VSVAADAPRVALVLATVGDLSGSGGTERQFSDLFDFLRRRNPDRFELVTTAAAVRRLRDAGRLASSDGMVALPLGSRPAQTRLALVWLTLTLLWVTIWRRWEVVHICQPTPAYLPYVAAITWLPRAWRPRVTMTVVDCTLAHNLLAPRPPEDLYERQVVAAHQLYARWTRLDGVFSWYRAFVEAAHAVRSLPARTLLVSARYCFTDPMRFTPAPAKERLVVFAGRLSEQKRPLLFVDAVARLLERDAALAAGWRFEMYGRGVLAEAVTERIRERGLAQLIIVTHALDLSAVFARSSLLVSTQAYENFTSLAMIEAMAAGNAVIAEDVGQTSEFVRNGENGILVTGATAEAFAGAIAEFLRRPDEHGAMGQASRAIATEVHTIEHFADDIVAFWAAVARR